jgi:hypothetical protein
MMADSKSLPRSCFSVVEKEKLVSIQLLASWGATKLYFASSTAYADANLTIHAAFPLANSRCRKRRPENGLRHFRGGVRDLGP